MIVSTNIIYPFHSHSWKFRNCERTLEDMLESIDLFSVHLGNYHPYLEAYLSVGA